MRKRAKTNERVTRFLASSMFGVGSGGISGKGAGALASSDGLSDFRPRQQRGMTAAAMLAVAAHGLLIAGLAVGVRWRTSEPTVLSAELWASTAQQAAPAPTSLPPPPPPPPVKVEPKVEPKPTPVEPKTVPSDADIALERKKQAERERQDKLAQDKRDKDKRDKEDKQREAKEKLEAERKAKAEDDKLAKQRDEQLKRMQAMAGATGAANAQGQALRDAAPSAEYGGRVKARIKPNIVFTGEAQSNQMAEVEVRVAATGRITGQRLLQSSGNKAWDEAVLRAVQRTEILPKDIDGRVPPVMVIEFRANE